MDNRRATYEVTLKLRLQAFDLKSAGESALEYVWGAEVFGDDPEANAVVVSVRKARKK